MRHPTNTDRGSILPIVLIVSVILALVTIAVANYTTGTLRAGQVTEQRADRFAAAQAALDDAIEKLEIKSSLCGTGVGAVVDPFPVVINNAPASVSCESIGGTAGDVEGWAVVLTSIGDPDDDLVIQSGGGVDKYIGGPVWMERLTEMDIKAPLIIENGDIWYPGGCDPSLLVDNSAILDPKLSFSPGNGTLCTTGVWSSIFRAPATSIPAIISATSTTPPTPDANGCTVFEPGRYNTAPVLGDNNYFKSGNYYFRNVGTIVVKAKTVLFGNIEGLEGFPAVENSPCDFARGSDSTSGATVYLGGDTRFVIEANGGLEFSRRLQIGSSKSDLVSVQVIDPGLGGQPTWSDPVMSTQPGNGKQLAIQGLIWAPSAGLQFGEVTNDTAAVLRGGAVLASLDAGASASATGFLIEIPTTPRSRLLELTATATNDGQTQLRAVVDWRVSNGDTALKTYRMCAASGC